MNGGRKGNGWMEGEGEDGWMEAEGEDGWMEVEGEDGWMEVKKLEERGSVDGWIDEEKGRKRGELDGGIRREVTALVDFLFNSSQKYWNEDGYSKPVDVSCGCDG